MIGALSYAEPITVNTVDIHIHKMKEAGKGIELGTDSRARGMGTIATGKNSIAIGKNAVATGGNETKETIDKKLQENKDKLAEIQVKEKEVQALVKELEDLKIREAETIAAGIRVKELALQKEKAKAEWNRLLGEYKTFVDGSAEFFRENQLKIDDLNSRLTGISKITGINISSEEGLTKAAQQLKEIVEKDTTLNLSEAFYKDYVHSYYTALGELRQNEDYRIKMDAYVFRDSTTSAIENEIKNPYYVGGIDELILGAELERDCFYVTTHPHLRTSLFKNAFNADKNITERPTADIKNINIDVDLVDKTTYLSVLENIPKYKKSFKEYFGHNNNRLLTQDTKNTLYEKWDLKMDYWQKQYEVAYYQWEYETNGKDTTWLDKKAKALEELKKIEINFNNVRYSNGKRTFEEAMNSNIAKWEKENITDIKEKNKITKEKLSSELEAALGINKEAIAEREKEIADKKALAENAENTYNTLNPSEKDLILAREYERVAKELQEKGNILKTSAERLQWLKDNLTLHDLKNVGADAIAIGTDSLASGNASIALGKANIATKENAVALGSSNIVGGENSIAIGVGNNVFHKNSISLGQENSIRGEKSIAIGYKHKIVGTGSSTIGDPNEIFGDNNHVYGNDNKVGSEVSPKNNVFILGSNIDATSVDNAVVLGNASTAVTGAISVGSTSNGKQIKFVKAGTEDSDAVNKKQLEDAVSTKVDTSVFNNYKSTIYNKTEIDEKLNNIKVGNVDISGKADTNLNNIANITDTAKEILIAKFSKNANMETPVGDLVTDTLLKKGLDTKVSNATWNTYKTEVSNALNSKADKISVYNKAETYNKTEVDNLLKKINNSGNTTISGDFVKLDGSNIDSASKESITKKLNEGANIGVPSNTLVTDTDVKGYLDANYTNNTILDTKFINLKTEINNTTDSKIEENNKNYYTKTEVDNKLTKVIVKTEGDITSNTLEVINGIDRLVGSEDLTLEIKNGAITEEKLHEDLKDKINGKVNTTTFNEYKTSVYNKTEVDKKLENIVVKNADLTGKITETEEKGVKGKVIDKHLKENYVNKKELQARDKMIVNNHQEIQANKEAIANNARRIEQVDKKVNKTAALAQATANLDFGEVRVGNVAIGAGMGTYSLETGVAVGLAYRPNEDFFLTAKMSILTGDTNYTSYGASASYQFNVK